MIPNVSQNLSFVSRITVFKFQNGRPKRTLVIVRKNVDNDNIDANNDTTWRYYDHNGNSVYQNKIHGLIFHIQSLVSIYISEQNNWINMYERSWHQQLKSKQILFHVCLSEKLYKKFK
jgi:hypothetical protein